MKNDENNRKGTLSPLKAVSAWMPAVFIAIGLLMLGICIRNGFGMVSSNSRVVAVRGLSEREVNANKVTWPIVSKIVGNDLTQIYSQVSATDDAIVNFLKKNGITDKEFQVNAPKVQDMQADSYGGTPPPYRYNVTTVVVVTSSQVAKIQELMNKQTELMQQGIAIVAGDYNYQTLYEFTELNQIKATANAREAAKKFADDSGSDLGKIKTASQGQFSIEDRDQYTPSIKRVRVVSTIEYYLKD